MSWNTHKKIKNKKYMSWNNDEQNLHVRTCADTLIMFAMTVDFH